jgi:aspartate ammonia-lyase
MGYDHALTLACASGNLELNPFLPLVADCLLHGAEALAGACKTLRENCVEGLEADADRCRRHVESATAAATALLPALGYGDACRLAEEARRTGKSLRALAAERHGISSGEFDRLVSPEAVCRLGYPMDKGQ